MLAALVAGERDPKRLAQLARARMRAKLSLLEEAFTGFFTDQHAFLLGKMLGRVDGLDADLAELDAKLQELIAPLAHAVERLDEIPGVGQTAAHLLIAELGAAMTRFPTDVHPSPGRTCPGSRPLGTGGRGPSSPLASRSPPASARAAARPGTATRIWLGCSARLPSPPARPIPSLGNATGGSAAAAAPKKRSGGARGP